MNLNRKVADLMTRDVIDVHIDDRIGKILEIFQSEEIHHLIVTKGDNLAGVISKNDILNLYESCYRQNDFANFSAVSASSIMTANPLTVESEDTIGLAASIFMANKLHSLPVVDDGEIKGILTSHDLLTYAYDI